jgi:hypothetical protein
MIRTYAYEYLRNMEQISYTQAPIQISYTQAPIVFLI